MLYQRILTALILIPLTLWAVFTDLPFVFSGFTALILLLAAWEWVGLMQFDKLMIKIGYMVFLVAVFALSLMVPLGGNLIVAVVLWLWMFAAVISYSLGKPLLGLDIKAVKFITSAPVLAIAWLGLNVLRQQAEGSSWVVYFLVLIWITDTAAYFGGKYLGKHKLAERVSPKKTWEGALSGVVVALIFTGCVMPWLPLYWEPWRILPIAFATVIFAVLGDLTESLLKRLANVKDSGHILPGHGGVLDRIDALIAAVPVFVLLQLAIF